MHANRALIPLFCVATLVVDACLVGSLSGRAAWPDSLVAVVMGLAAGQINLVTFWAVLRQHHLPWRVAVYLAVPIGWAFGIVAHAPKVLPGYGVPTTWAVHFLTQSVLFALILILNRLCGALLMPVVRTAEPRIRRGQFTLGYLLAWLTSSAIALSLLKTTFDLARLKDTDFDWWGILVLGFAGAMIGLASVWPILDMRDRMKRLAAAIVTILPVVAVVAVLGYIVSLRGRVDIFTSVLLLLMVAGVYSAIAWAVLRVAGYRLSWPHTMPVDSGPGSSK